MLPRTLPRPFEIKINLRPDEDARLRADAEKLGVSKAEALRRNCREFFTETVEQRGRIRGVSPWKRAG
jgi:hypothetical protein